MDQWIEFAPNHLFMVSSLAALIGMYAWMEVNHLKTKTLRLSVDEAIRLINQKNALVLDIRNEEAFKKGHIAGATRTDQQETEQTLKKANRSNDTPVIVVCERGIQSSTVANRLIKQALPEIFVLEGGIQAWTSAEQPLVKE